jgi:hypothetical protein
MELTILLITCHFGTCAHSSNNTEKNTTNAISSHFPPMIAWNKSCGIYPSLIRTNFHVLTDETTTITPNLSFWHMCTPQQQHWVRHHWDNIVFICHNWYNIQSFLMNDGLRNTSPGLPPRRIRKSFHVRTGESKNITQNMPFWQLYTLNHQHWEQQRIQQGELWKNCFSFRL